MSLLKQNLPPEEKWDCQTDDPEEMCESCYKLYKAALEKYEILVDCQEKKV